ncbi:4-hydroxy-2-oxovalerate aldolase [Cytospora mali]|uniref:4-hydroxy-2-oxovalerate aldolase n=1 Tax=Cytospora mali TaxID=578113 RepID=A0A194VA63_CYTMA|nr:4-hydroxy-2-oxovalerate aldolase [Valsa mali var. pyri (nom. inval.)]
MGPNFGQHQPEGMQAYAAPSLFQPHRARQAIRDAYDGKIPSMLGYYAGLSSVAMVHEIVFMSQGRTIPWVRIPGHDHASISFALDAGASLVIPQIETVEQARQVVSSAKYGTKQNGTRSAPPWRLLPGLTDTPYDSTRDIHSCLNDQAAIMIQIESLAGIDNLDAILTEVPDIDAVWLGSLDARVSMNLVGSVTGDEPEWLEAKARFHEILRKHRKPYGGFYLDPADENMREAAKDQQLMFISADVLALMGMYQTLVGARAVVNGDK